VPSPADIRTGFLLALVSACAFGVLPVFGKFAFAEGFEVATLLTWRFSIAAALIWALVLARGDPGGIAFRRRFSLLGLGALYGANSGLYFLALERIPATTTSLVFYIYPALVTLLGIAFLKRSVRPLELGALATSLVGVALTVGFATGELDPAGVGLALASAAVIAIYLVLGELVLADIPTVHATALMMTGTALAYLGWEAATGGLGLPPTPRGWLLVLVMATVSTALSILAMLAAIQRLGAGTTSIVITLETAVTAALAALLLNESLAFRQYAGGALILTGVVLLRVASRRRAVPVLADT
jgi:drug/metabolite transporter (DMT)-like permease